MHCNMVLSDCSAFHGLLHAQKQDQPWKHTHRANFLATVRTAQREKEKTQQLKHRPEAWNHHVKWLYSGLDALSPCTHPPHSHPLTHRHRHRHRHKHAVWCFCPSTYLVLLNSFRKTKWLEASHTGFTLVSESCCFLIIFRMFKCFFALLLLLLCFAFLRILICIQKMIQYSTLKRGSVRVHQCCLITAAKLLSLLSCRIVSLLVVTSV